ncbi:MAG: TlyA family RNA methyltransferase [Myxococcales bacterium]|nr:TlyA family RNA methyltransferase [Myxococcales bacterium]
MSNDKSTKVRLDQLVVARGLAESRHKAQALILAGQVLVNDAPATKAGTQYPDDCEVRLRGEPARFVSRGGEKLEAMLEHLGERLVVEGQVALDVGASTGGFTDCLLQRGARHVIAVDVGYGQLAWKLQTDSRVTSIERLNARNVAREDLRARVSADVWPPVLAVVDVSFISLRLVLPAVAAVLDHSGAPIVALVKPQFEAGRENVGKGGVVRGEVRQRAIDSVLRWLTDRGFEVRDTIDSPVAGPNGNVEALAYLGAP